METKKYAVLEFCSNKIKLLVGYMLNNQVYVLSMHETRCFITNDGKNFNKINEISKVINSLRLMSEKELDITIDSVYVVIPSFGFNCLTSKGSTRTHSGSNVDAMDIRNAIDYAKNIELSDASIVIDSIPYLYVLDNNDRMTFPPIGRKANHIEISAYLYTIDKAMIVYFDRILSIANLKVSNYIISPYAASCYLRQKHDEKLSPSYFLFDMGEGMTTFAFVKGGKDVAFSKVRRASSTLLTSNISQSLNISLERAEELKCLYGLDENPSFDFEIENGITLSKLSSIIKDFLNEPCDQLVEFMKQSKHDDRKLPIFIIGGGMNLKGVENYLKSKLQCEVIRPIPTSFGARNLSYISLLGGIVYAKEKEEFLNILHQDEKIVLKDSEFDLTREEKNGTNKL